MAEETFSVKRTFTPTDDQGNEIGDPVELVGEVTIDWPEARDESYERFFETEAAMWENELRGLQTKVKQAVGSYLLSNEGAEGLQEYIDTYQIGVRSHGGGRKKEIRVTDEALEQAGVDREQMESLAAALGLKIVDDE